MKDINIHYEPRMINPLNGKVYGYGMYVYLDAAREGGGFHVMPYHYGQTDTFEDCDFITGPDSEHHPFMAWFPHNFYIRAL